jgi:hypothetical protein
MHLYVLHESFMKAFVYRKDNAVDKLLGAEFLADRTPLRDTLLLLSDRARLELWQKAPMSTSGTSHLWESECCLFLLDCPPASKDAPTPRKEKLWNAEISSSRLSPRL